jgi:hypothetical protein
MGQKYEQLSLEQRCTIARDSQADYYVRKVRGGKGANLIFRSTLETQDVLFTSSL